MTQPIESRCLRCGRPDEGEGSRCRCGASLLVDVVLSEPAPEERTRFQLARALAVLGAPVPPFAELRKELERADGRVVRGVSRVFAQRVVEVLATQGAGAELRPAKDGAGRPGWLPLAAGGLALVALGVGAVTLKPRTPEALPSFIGVEDAGTRAQAAAPVERTTQDISKTSLPGTVSLRCEGSTGAGFFVGEELVLTNAHVACERGKYMEVSLEDGRRVLGETLERDETLDLATVRVSGARAEPLPLGDATLLSPGDRLVFIGSPKGLSFTVLVEKARAVVKAQRQSRDRMLSLTGEPMRERREQVETNNREAAASWSNAFRQAQTNLQRLEEPRRKYAQQYATGYNVRGNLDDVDRELKRARERLDDLERAASNAGIPREWRRKVR